MPSWSTPPTWTANEIVTAATMNKISTDLKLLGGANGSSVNGTVTTTTLTSFVAATGPFVTVTCGSHALVTISAQMSNSSNTRGCLVGLVINTVTPSATTLLLFYSNSKAGIACTGTKAVYVSGLTNGASTKFELRYKAVGGGTASFSNRSLFVQPLP